jgi:hypothetical protein
MSIFILEKGFTVPPRPGQSKLGRRAGRKLNRGKWRQPEFKRSGRGFKNPIAFTPGLADNFSC